MSQVSVTCSRNAMRARASQTDPSAIEGLLTRGEARLESYRHPDKYTGAHARRTARLHPPRRALKRGRTHTCAPPALRSRRAAPACAVPYVYGGSKYARNPPVPPEVRSPLGLPQSLQDNAQPRADADASPPRAAAPQIHVVHNFGRDM